MKKLTLTQFLKLLPGVTIDQAKELLGDGLAPFIVTGFGLRIVEEVTLSGVTIHRDDLTSLGLGHRLDARAADAILRLYAGGALPMKPGTSPQSVPEAENYKAAIAEHDKTEADERERQNRAVRDAARRRREIVENPELATEDDFCISLLNDIFLRHNGPGGGKLVIGGIEVTKSDPVPFATNSGKGRFWSYTYSWISEVSGKPISLDQRAPTELNRRNDPARDWGLPA